MMISLTTHSALQTVNIGKNLGKVLKKGDIIALIGELGSGKTTLSSGIAVGLGVKDYVRSPTFTLINEYQGRLPLYHFDLYRLSLSELEELGYKEYFYAEGVTIIEWAEKCEELLPEDHLRIELAPSPLPLQFSSSLPSTQRGEGEVEGERIKIRREERQIKIFLPEEKAWIAKFLKTSRPTKDGNKFILRP